MTYISIFCVTYHSYQEAEQYLRSLSKAISNAEDKVKVDVFMADNTENGHRTLEFQQDNNFRFTLFPYHENIGYFGAVSRMMQEVDLQQYDYTIISNVDLLISEDALLKLDAHAVDEATGWIAPQIWSQTEGRDRNPESFGRKSAIKLRLLRTLYQYPILDYLYTRTFYHTKRFHSYPPGNVYSGHGSFIILTRQYIQQCGKINYPLFLYGEEMYLAEQCRAHQLKVLYSPDIHIIDMEHVSTGKMKHSVKCRYNYDAIQYILKNFY